MTLYYLNIDSDGLILCRYSATAPVDDNCIEVSADIYNDCVKFSHYNQETKQLMNPIREVVEDIHPSPLEIIKSTSVDVLNTMSLNVDMSSDIKVSSSDILMLMNLLVDINTQNTKILELLGGK